MRSTLTTALAVALAVAVGASAGTAAAAASRTFTDPAGDAGTGFDISAVTVSNDNAGRITFRIGIPAVPTLPPNLNILIAVNSDLLPTGREGVDHIIVVSGGAAAIATPSSEFRIPQSLSSSFQPGVMTVLINRRDLGDTRGFTFDVATLPLAADGSLDTANADLGPNGGTWPFEVVLPTRLAVRSKALQPGRPTAGRPFTARMVVRDVTFGTPGTAAAGGTVTCAFSAGGARISTRGAVAPGGVVTCRGTMPADAAPGTLRGTARYRQKGATVTRAFAPVPIGGDVRKQG